MAALAADSAFLRASHSLRGICPGAFGQYLWPLNWECPVAVIGCWHTLQLYCFLFCSDASTPPAAAPALRLRHCVVLDTERETGAHGGCGCATDAGA